MHSSAIDFAQRVLGSIWASNEAHDNLRYLCDICGSRFGGTESEHKAGEFLLARMTEYGFRNPHIEEFPVYSWRRGTCHFSLSHPIERSISAIAMPFCGSGDFSAEIVDIGDGEADDFERMKSLIPGKAVLSAAETNRSGELTLYGTRHLHRTDKYRLAVKHGAIACVFANSNPGGLHISGALYAQNPGGMNASDHEAEIPAIGVTYEAGSMIRRLAESGAVKSTLSLKNETYLSRSYNVVGDIPGKNQNDVILFGGHYDGHDIAFGAGDNAAGMLVGLEVGRVLAPLSQQLNRTVRIVCFGYEELGLGGSWKHAERYQPSLTGENLLFMMNLDGAGRGKGGNSRIATQADAGVSRYFEDLFTEHSIDVRVVDQISANSDNFPFFLAGFPSAQLSSEDAAAGMVGRGYGHTEADTLDKVTLHAVQLDATLATRIALFLSEVGSFPMNRRTESEVRDELARAGMLDLLSHHWGRENRVVQ